tara:strand:+ start:487 stop:1626 length:1140 start_codon:yes stop_codon:yes gene_type:complete
MTSTTLRDTISAAYEEPEAAPEQAPEQAEFTEPTFEPSDLADSPADDSPAAEAADASKDLNALSEEAPEVEAPIEEAPRNEKSKTKGKDEGMTPGPKSGPKPQGERAPASWKPETREHWAALPEGVRAEVSRRESEVARTLQETAEGRRSYEAVMKTIEPYQHFIKAENSNPLQAIDNLMATAARLRTGTAPELATMVAGMVSQFGVGRFGNGFVELLDQALSGQQVKVDPQQAALDQVLDQRLAPMQNMLQRFEQAQQQNQAQSQQSATNEVASFLSRAEFGEDVREDMADLLEVAQRKGQNLSLGDAYKKACVLNDNVRAVLSQRVQAKGAQGTTQAAQRARSAAVQVSGAAPMGGPKQEATNVRNAIEAAISMSSR